LRSPGVRAHLPATSPRRLGRRTGAIAGYEPSTHLLAVREDNAVQFAHVDPRTGVISEPVGYLMAGPRDQYRVYLLDPARSRGNVALVLETDDTNDPTARILRDHGVTAEGRLSGRRSPDGTWLSSGSRCAMRRDRCYPDGSAQNAACSKKPRGDSPVRVRNSRLKCD
jgi:hypothetical protein